MTITTIASVVPSRISMRDVAARLRDRPGGEVLSYTIDQSEISMKGSVVDLVAEDPWSWSAEQRMTRAASEASELCYQAVKQALAACGTEAADVRILAFTSTTVHTLPGLGGIAARLGMRPDTRILTLGPMGCYAAVPALDITRSLVEVYQQPAVLVCTDVYSPHLQGPPYDKETAVIFSLFSDAASAVVMHPASSGRPGLEVVDTQQLTAAEHSGDLTVTIGDAGLLIHLSPHMPKIVSSAVRVPVTALLERHGLEHGDIDWWALHPGGRKVITDVANALNMPAGSVAASRTVLREYGNAIGPAVLLVLEHLHNTAPLAAGRHGMALAFGPGATIWAMLLRATEGVRSCYSLPS